MAMKRCPIHDTVLNAAGDCLLCDYPELDPGGMTAEQAQAELDAMPDGPPEDGFVDDVMANVFRAVQDGGHAMVGGTVIGIARGAGGTLLHVEDKGDYILHSSGPLPQQHSCVSPHPQAKWHRECEREARDADQLLIIEARPQGDHSAD